MPTPVARFATRNLLLPVGILLVGLIVTFLLVQAQTARNKDLIDRQFNTQVERISEDIARRVNGYEYGLRGARGAISAVGAQAQNRDAFLRYSQTRDVDREFPGARGFGFIRRVPARESAAFVTQARADGWPTFDIKELAPNAGERFVIQYIEPVDRNLQAVGLDIASEANRRNAALEALRLNRATITAPITLVQATGAVNRAFLILLPLFHQNAPVRTPEQRQAAAWGWSYAPLVLDEVLGDLLRRVPKVQWSVYDVADDDTQSTILTQDQDFKAGSRTRSVDLNIYNRTWRVSAVAAPGYGEDMKLTPPVFVGASSLTVTLLTLTASLLFAGVRRRERDSMALKSQLATIIEHSDQAVIGEDNEGRVMMWNRAAERLFGLPGQRVMNRPLPDALAEAGLRLGSAIPSSHGAFDEGNEDEELTLSGADRTPLVLMASRSPILSEHGERLGKATLLMDITERRVMEDALADSNQMLEQKVQDRTAALAKAEAFLQTVLDSVPSVISYWDAEGRIRAANAAFLRWCGLSREALLGRTLHDVLPPSRIEGLHDEVDRARQGELRATVFRAHDEATDQWRHFSGTLVPDRSADTQLGLYFVADDVTELQKSRQALEQSLDEQHAERVRLASIIEGTNVGTWEWNVQTGETRFNERWAEMVGHTLAELAPVDIQTWARLAHPDDLQASNERLTRHFSGETPYYEFEARMRHRDGHWIWVLDRGRVTTWTADGQPEWMYGTHQDVTARHAMEEDLRAATRQAESANAAKSQFLANMSHEIRTPLNAVLGMHRLLQNTGLDQKQRDLLAKADQAGHSLLDILNDVLDLAKIEAGEMSLLSEAFDLQDVLDELNAIYSGSAAAKSITFSAELAGLTACWMMGDRLRLRQILANLVGNAIKFTQVGGVSVLARVERRPDEDLLRITVRDSGIGIPPDAVERLFKPFSQAEDYTTRRFGGTGLGLSIVRTLAELMGGSVSVSSTPGRGSEFVVVLPLHEVSDDEVERARKVMRPIAVGYLCAEPAVCEELNQRLEALGWTGVDLSEVFEERPDIVLVDAALGRQALPTARLAAAPDPALPLGNVLIVGTDEELAPWRDCAGQGARFVGKPIGISALFNAIVEHFSGTEELQVRLMGQSGAISGGIRWLDGARVIVVDDSDINREIAVELLRSQGAICEDFDSGHTVVARLQNGDHDVDAVLMDVQMPVMDGLQATRLIRERAGDHALPIIALTAGALQSERDNAMAAGMSAFLTKPLEPVNVVRTLRRFIHLRRGRPPEVTVIEPQAVAASTAANDSAPDWPDIDGIERATAMERLMGNRELFEKMLRLMVDGYADWSAHWMPRVETLDAPAAAALTASLHKLRGSASMIGAIELAKVADVAEQHHREFAERGEPRHVSAVGQALNHLLQAIADWHARSAAGRVAPDGLDALEHTHIEHLEALLHLVRANDLDAVEAIAQLQSALVFVMGSAGYADFEALINKLDFDQAARLLERALQQLLYNRDNV